MRLCPRDAGETSVYELIATFERTTTKAVARRFGGEAPCLRGPGSSPAPPGRHPGRAPARSPGSAAPPGGAQRGGEGPAGGAAARGCPRDGGRPEQAGRTARRRSGERRGGLPRPQAATAPPPSLVPFVPYLPLKKRYKEIPGQVGKTVSVPFFYISKTVHRNTWSEHKSLPFVPFVPRVSRKYTCASRAHARMQKRRYKWYMGMSLCSDQGKRCTVSCSEKRYILVIQRFGRATGQKKTPRGARWGPLGVL